MLENYHLLDATRAMGMGDLASISLTDMKLLHAEYGWEYKGIEFHYYVRVMCALDEITREHHKEPRQPANG